MDFEEFFAMTMSTPELTEVDRAFLLAIKALVDAGKE